MNRPQSVGSQMDEAFRVLKALANGKYLSIQVPDSKVEHDALFARAMSLQSDNSPLRWFPAHHYISKLNKATESEIDAFLECYHLFLAQLESQATK